MISEANKIQQEQEAYSEFKDIQETTTPDLSLDKAKEFVETT